MLTPYFLQSASNVRRTPAEQHDAVLRIAGTNLLIQYITADNLTVTYTKGGEKMEDTYSNINGSVWASIDEGTEIYLDVEQISNFDASGSALTYIKVNAFDFQSPLSRLSIHGCNVLEYADLSGSGAVGEIECQANPKLEYLNVSGLTSLTSLVAYGCFALTEVITSNSAISSLSVSDAINLKTLDVKEISSLSSLRVDGCILFTELDLSGLTDLKDITAYNCSELTSINMTGCVGLERINFENCPKLTQLDLAGLSALIDINVGSCSGLSALNLSGLDSLSTVYIPNTGIEYNDNYAVDFTNNLPSISGAYLALSYVGKYATEIKTAAEAKGWSVTQQ